MIGSAIIVWAYLCRKPVFSFDIIAGVIVLIASTVFFYFYKTEYFAPPQDKTVNAYKARIRYAYLTMVVGLIIIVLWITIVQNLIVGEFLPLQYILMLSGVSLFVAGGFSVWYNQAKLKDFSNNVYLSKNTYYDRRAKK
ncbi:MAG: hypothetical protein L6265_02965 [Thermoplasmatales archaeon]|nr:hypothetical protein [Thermoplasmatales archaeon]